MAYDPQFVDAANDTIEIIIRAGGRVYREYQVLGDCWAKAKGPMSYESACLGSLRRVIVKMMQDEIEGIGLGDK